MKKKKKNSMKMTVEYFFFFLVDFWRFLGFRCFRQNKVVFWSETLSEKLSSELRTYTPLQSLEEYPDYLAQNVEKRHASRDGKLSSSLVWFVDCRQ